MKKKMKKTKEQKAITLVALIITIVLLLILAVVAIRAVTGGEGIIEYARKAGLKHEQEKSKELDILDGYLSEIETNMRFESKSYSS